MFIRRGVRAMANPRSFLDEWAKENVQAPVSDDKATVEKLAFECKEAARAAGFSEASIVKAAGGNLEAFLLDRLNGAVNAQVDRLVAKDKR
jgi:hypothetical protein